MTHDYRSFYKSEEVYKGFKVPWKRGLIVLGVSGIGWNAEEEADAGIANWKWEDYQLESYYEGSSGADPLCQAVP